MQVCTARFVGRFLTDPLEVPPEVVAYVAGQLGIGDVSLFQRYAERRATPFEHQDKIRQAYGLREFGEVEAEFTAWVDARAWTTGNGKKLLFHEGVVWLRERKVLLPGVSTLARLVAWVRDEATDRLHQALYGVLTSRQRAVLELLLEVPDGRRASDLERWRRGLSVPSGRNMEKALERAGEILSVGAGQLVLPPEVPYRRVVSIYTGEVRAHDVLRMIQRDGTPTPLGDAIAHYGRIFKTLHILTYAVEEPYRRDIKGIRNLQESRHALASRIFHGKKGELYYKGMEDQLGALGLVLNCVTLWNTFYIDTALAELKRQGYPVRDEDVARLSPFVRAHINVNGTYSFTRPDLGPTGIRPLRDPGQDDEGED
ncbi:hypothetical protein GCM10022221_31410 [Actinocorallia aurea]